MSVKASQQETMNLVVKDGVEQTVVEKKVNHTTIIQPRKTSNVDDHLPEGRLERPRRPSVNYGTTIDANKVSAVRRTPSVSGLNSFGTRSESPSTGNSTLPISTLSPSGPSSKQTPQRIHSNSSTPPSAVYNISGTSPTGQPLAIVTPPRSPLTSPQPSPKSPLSSISSTGSSTLSNGSTHAVLNQFSASSLSSSTIALSASPASNSPPPNTGSAPNSSNTAILHTTPIHAHPASSLSTSSTPSPVTVKPTATANSNKQQSSRVRIRLTECNLEHDCKVPAEVPGGVIKLTSAAKSQVKVLWDDEPQTIIIVKKFRDDEITKTMKVIANWLKSRGKRVLVEPAVAQDELLGQFEVFDLKDPGKGVDLIVCLGGDGTLLYVNSLFQNQKDGFPPIISFAAGSLGFLTPFDVRDYKPRLETVLKGHGSLVSLRMRLLNKVYKSGETEPYFTFQVLNELLVDRGTSPYLSKLDLLVDNEYVTTVQADGLIISTPTGSTAYSMSAGGSMVAPTVPGIIITPICPHTLSFRPLILPDCSVIRITIPTNSRHGAYASFDGRHSMKMQQGDSVEVCMSNYPVPSINMGQFNSEWFASIKQKLNWNVREQQKPLPEEPTDRRF